MHELDVETFPFGALVDDPELVREGMRQQRRLDPTGRRIREIHANNVVPGFVTESTKTEAPAGSNRDDAVYAPNFNSFPNIFEGVMESKSEFQNHSLLVSLDPYAPTPQAKAIEAINARWNSDALKLAYFGIGKSGAKMGQSPSFKAWAGAAGLSRLVVPIARTDLVYADGLFQRDPTHLGG